MSISIDTIGSLIDNGYTLTAFCEDLGCRHSQVLDLEALAERLGRDFELVGQIQSRLSCSRCGSRNVSVILHPPGVDQIGGYHAGH